MNAFPPPFAVVGQPLFGNQWLALAVILVGVAVFMAVVAGAGRWLAATHTDAPPRPAPLPAPAETGPGPEIMAVIAAAVAVTAGPRVRIASVQLAPPAAPPSVEMLMQQWSIEGRRQIYSSHQVR
jgi:hypothetical protein